MLEGRFHKFLAGSLPALMLFTAAPAIAAGDNPVQTTATYGAWTVSCRALEADAARQCEMKQAVGAPGQQGVVANLALGQLRGESETRLVVQLPIGVHLPSDVMLEIAGSDPVKAEFEACFPNFCLARVTVDNAQIEDLKLGETLNVQFRTLAKRDVKLAVSLAGFSAAYDSLLKEAQ